MIVNISTVLVALATCYTAVQAVPATYTQGKRSTVSNGVTCYYNCPDPSAVTYSGTPCSSLMSGGNGGCMYFCGGFMETCQYNVGTGAFTSTNGPIVCPAQTSMTCGGSQGPTQFKRDNIARHELTDAERIIAERQYKPAKVAE